MKIGRIGMIQTLFLYVNCENIFFSIVVSHLICYVSDITVNLFYRIVLFSSGVAFPEKYHLFDS